MKNAGHVAGKTVLTLAIASLCFWALGFGLGFGNGNSFFGTTGFFYGGDSTASAFESLAFSDVTLNTKFLFQMAFAAVSWRLYPAVWLNVLSLAYILSSEFSSRL